jgi:hypothetical protein
VDKGEYHIIDGHHRANHAIKMGQPLQMKIYNHNGKNSAFEKWQKKTYR